MALTEFVKASHEIILFHFVFFSQLSEFEDSHETLEFFEPHFEKFVVFIPRLGVIKDSLVPNTISDNYDAASLAMFTDDSQGGDNCRA